MINIMQEMSTKSGMFIYIYINYIYINIYIYIYIYIDEHIDI